MPGEVKVTKRSGKRSLPETNIVGIRRTRAAWFQSVYADNAQLSVNFFGISMLVGEATEISDGALNVTDHVVIHMSPEHAVSLHALLGAQIEKYRENFGDIRPAPAGKEQDAKG